MTGHIIKITLENTHPPVWRRIIIPEHISFESLHEIIQAAFDWTDDHMHDFSFPGTRDRIIMDMDEGSLWGKSYSEKETDVDDFLKKYKYIRYTYDFGDDWRHKIVFEKDDPAYTYSHASLLKYKGDSFMEDSGGVFGYGFMDDEDEYVSNRIPFDSVRAQLHIKQIPLNFIKK